MMIMTLTPDAILGFNGSPSQVPDISAALVRKCLVSQLWYGAVKGGFRMIVNSERV
jgi:hypothetical protein